MLAKLSDEEREFVISLTKVVRSKKKHSQRLYKEKREAARLVGSSSLDVSEDTLQNVVVGAMVQSIKEHGPINFGNVPSATKRVVGQILGFAYMAKKTKGVDSPSSLARSGESMLVTEAKK